MIVIKPHVILLNSLNVLNYFCELLSYIKIEIPWHICICNITRTNYTLLISWCSILAESVKVCRMGPWFVYVSPCFRENVVGTCKIGSFLCSLDNFLQKDVIVFLFGNGISKWCSFEKGAIFDLLFTFFCHQGKLQKILQHISHPHTYTYFAHPIDFFVLPILKKIRIYQIWFLIGMIPGVDSYSRHCGTINK